MNLPTHNPNDKNTWQNTSALRSSVMQTMRIGITRTTAGWYVDISSLSPNKTTGFGRDDLLEMSNILCRSKLKCTKPCNGSRTHVQEYDDALAIVADALAKYAARILCESVSPLDLGLVDRLLDRTGCISVKPIETKRFSTFLDIGINSSCSNKPADLALIYDIPSDSWHGD